MPKVHLMLYCFVCISFSNLKWQRGLQAVAGLMSLSFFMGLFYRSASLYHPQRRAILFMKNQRKKVNKIGISSASEETQLIVFKDLASKLVKLYHMKCTKEYSAIEKNPNVGNYIVPFRCFRDCFAIEYNERSTTDSYM